LVCLGSNGGTALTPCVHCLRVEHRPSREVDQPGLLDFTRHRPVKSNSHLNDCLDVLNALKKVDDNISMVEQKRGASKMQAPTRSSGDSSKIRLQNSSVIVS
jgi:hypothetical protein